MPVIKIEVPEEFIIKGAGAETTVKVADYTDEALFYVFKYGLGRAHQDRANSIRDKLQKAGNEADGDAILADVAKRLAAGEINQRGGGSGLSAEEIEFRRVVAELVREDDPAEWKRSSDDYRTKLIDRKIESLAEDDLALLREEAAERLAEKRRKAERKAKLKSIGKV